MKLKLTRNKDKTNLPAGWVVCSSDRTGWQFCARRAPPGGTPPRTGWSPWSGEGREWPWRRVGRATWGCREGPPGPGRRGSWWWSIRTRSSAGSLSPRTWTCGDAILKWYLQACVYIYIYIYFKQIVKNLLKYYRVVFDFVSVVRNLKTFLCLPDNLKIPLYTKEIKIKLKTK